MTRAWPADTMESTWGLDLLHAAAARADDPLWVGAWRTVAFLGTADFFAIALPVLFSLASSRWSLRLTLAFAASATLTEALKQAVDRARPDVLALGLPQALEDPGVYASAAFPSGHTLMAMAIWGTVLLRARSHIVRAACVILILAIGASRVALLRHDLLDVMAGLVLGSLLLLVLYRAENAWRPALATLPRVERAGLWLLAAAGLQIAVGLEITAVVLGVAAGLGGGSLAFAGWRRRHRAPARWAGVARIGLALLGAAGARAVAEPGAGLPVAVLFGVYLLAGLWVGGLVPAVLGGVRENEGDDRSEAATRGG